MSTPVQSQIVTNLLKAVDKHVKAIEESKVEIDAVRDDLAEVIEAIPSVAANAGRAEAAADRAEDAAANFVFASLPETHAGENETHSMNPLRVRQYIQGGTYKPSLNGARDMPITKIMEQWVQPEWFGAKGDGISDDGDAIEKAIATGRDVFFGKSVYLCGRTLVVSTVGQRLVGVGGITGINQGTEIRFSNTSGAAIWLRDRSTGLQRIHIGATTDRLNSGAADGRGLFIGGVDDNPATNMYISRTFADDVFITNQPSDGFYAIGTLELSRFNQVTVADCLGHGFVHDAGTIAGYSNLKMPAFWVDYTDCRAFECAGNAFVIRSDNGQAAQGVILHRPEALGCCWDASKVISNWMMLLTGSNIYVVQPDVEDQQYNKTTTESTGIPRLSKATPSGGILPSGIGHSYIQPYFSSLTQSIGGSGVPRNIEVVHPRIFAGAYGILQNPAISFPTGSVGVSLKADTSSATGASNIVVNQSTDAMIIIDGKEFRGLPTTISDWQLITTNPPTSTISSGTVDVRTNKVLLAGEGGVADSLVNIRIGIGVNGYVGLSSVLIYTGQDITFSTTGNIGIIGGGTLIMNASRPVITATYDGSKWWVQ